MSDANEWRSERPLAQGKTALPKATPFALPSVAMTPTPSRFGIVVGDGGDRRRVGPLLAPPAVSAANPPFDSSTRSRVRAASCGSALLD